MATALRALLLAKYLTGVLGGACTPVDSCPKLSDGLLGTTEFCCVCCVWNLVLSEKKILLVPLGDFFLDDLAAISQHLFPRVFTQQNGWILVLKKIPKWITFIMITNNCASSRNQHYYLGGGNSNIFYFHPYLGKIPNLTTVFFFGSVETTNQIHP